MPVEGIRAAKLACVRTLMDFSDGHPRRASGVYLFGIDVSAHRVVRKIGRPPHEIARLLAIAKIIHHQLDAVVVGIFVVKGCRGTVIRRTDGLDFEQSQSAICCQKVVKRWILERDVMQPLVLTALLIVCEARNRHDGNAMIGKIVADPRNLPPGIALRGAVA